MSILGNNRCPLSSARLQLEHIECHTRLTARPAPHATPQAQSPRQPLQQDLHPLEPQPRRSSPAAPLQAPESKGWETSARDVLFRENSPAKRLPVRKGQAVVEASCEFHA